MDDGRVSFVGEIKPVPEGEAAAVRKMYLQKHPGHFWVGERKSLHACMLGCALAG